MEKVKVALIGYGYLGRWHAEKVVACKNAELVAIVEPVPELQLKAQSIYPNIKIVDSLDVIIDEIEAGVIVTPTTTHAELAIALVEKKKHVFVEKPLCENLEEAARIKNKINPDIVFQVGHSERCHEAWEILNKNEHIDFSNKAVIKINRVAPFKGRATDVDVVHDLMIHDIDLILYLTNKLPVSIKAQGFKSKTSKNDHVNCIMAFSDGTIAYLTSSRNFLIEERSFEWTDCSGSTLVNLANNKILSNTSESLNQEYSKRDHLLIEHEHFYDSILNDREIFVTFSDGEKTLTIIDSIMKSIESGKEEEIKYKYE